MAGARSLHLALGDVCAGARHFAELPPHEEGAEAAAGEQMERVLGDGREGEGGGEVKVRRV